MSQEETDKKIKGLLREVVREELDKTTWELPTHTHEKKGETEKEEVKPEKEETCDDCGTKVRKDSKFCRGCGGEFDRGE